ncbi:CRISPR-associated helicase Cas3' [Tropicimonas sp.]|uniref:CRISPR-associated helicase Cas3' n=1 Tax=Tropicimonas sp. TaxID=2067044 RepID=UPI003A860204
MIWAKTFETGVKSLPAHLLDVAAVMAELNSALPDRLAREAAVVGLPAETLGQLRVALAALHDLGKCSDAFQGLRADLCSEPLVFPSAVPRIRHWRLTARLFACGDLAPVLDRLFPALDGDDLAALLAPSAGHHGQPPAPDDWAWRGHHPVQEALRIAAAQIAVAVLDAAGIEPLEISDPALIRLISWQSAGLVTLADWVGSDAEFFGPGDPSDLPSYFREMRLVARAALAAKGLLPGLPNPGPGLAAISPEAAADPRPMQRWAETVALPEGPCIAVIEDITGSGKTEAALVLAARMMAAGKGEGLYFALPTEATANAMFERLVRAHRGLFAGGCLPSLVLAHGHAAMNAPFRTVRNADPDSAEAQCNDWIADHRRKAFFADVGAGTVDQALLAVLPKRFSALRLAGLAGRVLIVDEAHAYDAYMGIELQRLLEAHALAGGSVIVLSATLPQRRRVDLVSAFTGAAGGLTAVNSGGGVAPRTVELTDVNHFPLATLAARHHRSAEHIPAASERTVRVARATSREAVAADALAAAGQGAAVLVLCNAVDEAIAMAARLPGAELFHARFAICDRQEIEARALTRFGKTGQGREGRILVATQVVEQSLDVDFDVIFTDLAPVDLLIQRAGRLWRHPRGARPLPEPVLHVLSPAPDETVGAGWLDPVLGKAAAVYRDPAVMWRSAQAVFGAGRIVAPGAPGVAGGLRSLIEAVYGDAPAPVPPGLERGATEAEGDSHGASTLARLNTVTLDAGYGAHPVTAEQEIGTRLGEAVTVRRLARLERGRAVPWAPGPDQAWPRSEIAIRRKWLAGLEPAPEVADAAAAARADWRDWEPDVAIVADDGQVMLQDDAGQRPLRYDRVMGLSAGRDRLS